MMRGAGHGWWLASAVLCGGSWACGGVEEQPVVTDEVVAEGCGVGSEESAFADFEACAEQRSRAATSPAPR